MFVRPENWNALSPSERRELRLASWMSTKNRKFATPKAEEMYRTNAQRFADIIRLKKPDRVPCLPFVGGFVFTYGGISPYQSMYEYDALAKAYTKFVRDFGPDFHSISGFFPGKMYDTLDYRSFKWPGHGIPRESPFQYVEAEYMQVDEYDELIADPESFCMRRYIPRAFAALDALKNLPISFGSVELAFSPSFFVPFGTPEMQQALKVLLEAGKQGMEWSIAAGNLEAAVRSEFGIPASAGGYSKAPFDFPGDTLRGTRAIMIDMHRVPNKILAACERLVPIAIRMGVEGATNADNPFVMFPLHKGADDFMSRKNFMKFYWPTFKAVMLGLIQEGVIPSNFVEGAYNQRLDLITDPDIPAGSTYWSFDKTDMTQVKKHLGGWAAFGGNIPGSMLYAGSPKEVEDYVKNLIDTAGQDGSFALATGVVVDHATPENMHAMFNTVKEYGKY